MAYVSVRYNAKTGQPYVIRVPDGPDDNPPPLEPHDGEKVVLVPMDKYLSSTSHEDFLRNIPQLQPYYTALDVEKTLADQKAADLAASLLLLPPDEPL